jgi:hypothetical protein
MLNSGNNDWEQNWLLLSPKVESDCNPWMSKMQMMGIMFVYNIGGIMHEEKLANCDLKRCFLKICILFHRWCHMDMLITSPARCGLSPTSQTTYYWRCTEPLEGDEVASEVHGDTLIRCRQRGHIESRCETHLCRTCLIQTISAYVPQTLLYKQIKKSAVNLSWIFVL